MKTITLVVLVANAIVVFALGAVVLHRGIKKRCKDLLRFSALYFGLSGVYALVAIDAMSWVILTPLMAFGVVSMLYLDKAIERLNKPTNTDTPA
jgi:hypothetical protein